MTQVVVADRYEVVRALGKGAFGHTLLAQDRREGREVALKVLSLDGIANWKAFELFEREAAVLRHLRHSGVPEIYETFRAPWNGADSAWLAMEYIEGPTLAECIESSRSLDLAGVRRVFMEMLGILDYLHSRVPPVLHRDIKPANVILRPNGSVALVDFGSVRNVVRGVDDAGSTVAGTYGYMPYEQYMGQATPASDLYSAAATLLHIITGRPPSEWMTEEGRVQVPHHASCGEPLRSILVRLLSPTPIERFQSAREVMDELLAGAASVGAGTVVPRRSRAVAQRAAPPAPALLQPDTPRPIEGETKTLLRKLSYSSWQLMSSERDPNSRPSGLDIATIVFFSVITVGILPLMMWSHARGRRKKVERFLMEGIPGIARILDMEKEKIGFEVTTTRVRYEFEADGRTHRDADSVLPTIAVRWDAGDYIHILYRPDNDYDSIIISTN